jgi:hypothetical protein
LSSESKLRNIIVNTGGDVVDGPHKVGAVVGEINVEDLREEVAHWVRANGELRNSAAEGIVGAVVNLVRSDVCLGSWDSVGIRVLVENDGGSVWCNTIWQRAAILTNT